MATISHPNVRNIAPRVFGGKQEDWEEFAFKFRIFIGLQGTAIARMLREADATTEPIKDDIVKLDREGKADEVALSRHTCCQLAQLVEGPPGLILRSMPEDNGFEAWRLLTQRYKSNQGMKALGQLRNILNPSFPEANFEDAFLQWEAEVEKYERTFAAQVQDIMKVVVVLHTRSGPLQHHTQLTAGAAQAYQKVRDVILDYHRSRTHFKILIQPTAQPAECGFIANLSEGELCDH